MKIGFFTDAYFPQVNGVVTSVYETTKGLRSRGHEVVIIAPFYPNYNDTKKDNVIRLSSIPIHKKLNIRLATHLPDKTLLNLYKNRFDIIHAHGGGTISLLGLEIARIKNIPIVFTYHTLWNKYTHYLLKGVVRPKVVERISRIVCNRCTAIIAPTNRIKNELISYGVKKPIFVLPSGVDLERFKGKNIGFLRKKLKLKNECGILLSIGRLGIEKSIDYLIKAFGLVAKENKNTVLVIVGDGPEKQNLQNLTKELGLEERVYFTGNIDFEDMPLIYKDAYLLLFASQTETQGMVILEALASNVPVVAVNDAVYDGIIESKVNGILVGNDQEEFAQECLYLLNNPTYRKELSENARVAVQKFSVERTAEALEKLYGKLIYDPFDFAQAVRGSEVFDREAQTESAQARRGHAEEIEA